jgi:hypothetical protein
MFIVTVASYDRKLHISNAKLADMWSLILCVNWIFIKLHVYDKENGHHVDCEKHFRVIIVNILSFYLECFSLSDEI